jgi:hypothetical protein
MNLALLRAGFARPFSRVAAHPAVLLTHTLFSSEHNVLESPLTPSENFLGVKKRIARLRKRIYALSQEERNTMSISDSLLAAGGGGLVNQLASRFGINPEQATSAVSALLPMLAGGMKEKITNSETGLTTLLTGQKMSQFAGDLSTLASPDATNTGNDLMSRIFSQGETSKMISTVAEKVGIDSSTIGKMLPLLTTFLGGLVSKSVAGGGNLTDTLTQFSEAGHTGVLEAVKSLASKMFG